jgi:hypothetical protein
MAERSLRLDDSVGYLPRRCAGQRRWDPTLLRGFEFTPPTLDFSSSAEEVAVRDRVDVGGESRFALVTLRHFS